MLTVITGTMGSGKSEKLITSIRWVRYFNEYDNNGYVSKTLLCTHNKVTGAMSKENIRSHYGENYLKIESRNGEFEWVDLVNPLGDELTADYDYYYFDECQFMNASTIKAIVHLSQIGKQVYCAGLTTSFSGTVFAPMSQLLAYAHKVARLKSTCVVTGKPAFWNELIGEDGTLKESYRAVCWDVFKNSKHCKI